MITDRWKEIEPLKLDPGSHAKLEEGACIMEMVSYLANEPWSDHPKCACPILTEYAIRINDRLSDEHRQLLKPLVPLLVNTKSTDEIQIARKRLMMWRHVTVVYPLILDLVKLPKIATALRKLPNTVDGMAEAKEILATNKEKIYADANANAYANAYANADAYAYAYADADADANAYAYADAYANAYANAYAYAKKLKQQLAEAAVETLRLAIGIKNVSQP